MTELYKWQYKDYKNLSLMHDSPCPAILISGIPGLGQDQLIRSYIALMLCDSISRSSNDLPSACNSCQSCTLLNHNNHPDFYELAVDIEADRKNISVEDVRNMLEFLSTTTHLGKYKIVLIPNVDLLNISSANALLKILEEPPAYVLFVLQTNNLAGILPTIKSRCRIYPLSGASTEDAEEYVASLGNSDSKFWLNYYDNAPLFEVEISETQLESLIGVLTIPSVENIFKASAEFDAKDASFLLGFLTKWLNDMVSFKQGVSLRYFNNYQSQIESLALKIDLQQVFYLFDKINFLEDWALHPLNYKLQLENLLFQYQHLFISR